MSEGLLAGTPLPRLGRIFAEQLTIIAGEPAEILEAMLQADLGYCPDIPWRQKIRMHRTTPPVPEKGNRADA